MEGTIAADALSRGLTAARSAVPSKSTIPILRNVRMTPRDGHVEIEATNLEQYVTLQVPAALSGEPVAVDPQRLLATISTIRGDVSVKRNGNQIAVSGKGGRSVIALAPEENWTLEAPEGAAHSMTLDGDKLRHAMTVVSPAAITDESRFYLKGVHLLWRADGLFAEACDGHMALRVLVDDRRQPDWWPQDSIIVPLSAVRLLNSVMAAGDVGLSVTPGHIAFDGDGARLTSKRIDGDYPALDNFRAQSPSAVMRADRLSLAAALSAAAKFSEEGAGKFRVTALADGSLLGFGEVGEVMHAEAEMEVIDAQPIFLNPIYLTNALRAMAGEVVEICVGTGPGSRNIEFCCDGIAFCMIGSLIPNGWQADAAGLRRTAEAA